MKWVYLTLAAILAVIFLRGDAQLFDLIWNAHPAWSLAAALFLGGILVGQWMSGYRARPETGRWAFWGVFAVMLLGLVEYSIEWEKSTLIAPGDTIVLSAANVETVTQHFVPSRDGLFHTEVMVNGTKAEALLDTGASLVLLNHATAMMAGVDVSKLAFDQPVETASGPLKIARVNLDELSVGPIHLRNVEAAVSPPGQQHSNLLGASFLSRLESATFKANSAVLQQAR